MESLKTQHQKIRVVASKELDKFGIKHKLKTLPKPKNSTPHTKCYEVPLDKLEKVEVKLGSDSVLVPKVFKNLVEFIHTDLKQEGLFRREGSKVKQKNLVKVLDKGLDVPQDTGVIEATAVLKVFLRNLPGRLIPRDFTRTFHQAAQLPKNTMEAYNFCTLLLPLYNIYLLLYLMQFFNKVTQHASDNKMNSYNLAVVIGPNLFAETGKESETIELNLKITKALIEQGNQLGQVPLELFSTPEQSERKKSSKWRLCCC